MMDMHERVLCRIATVRQLLWPVLKRSDADWLALMDSAADVEGVLRTWEIVAIAWAAFFEARTPTEKARDQALRVLLDRAAGLSEQDIHQAAYKSLSIAEIRNLLLHFAASAEAAEEIAKRARV